MRWLLFLSRVALICNICYLVMIVSRYLKVDNIPMTIQNTVLVLAFSGILLNLFVSIAWLISIARGKKIVPIILGIVNLLFLVLELVNSALGLY